MCSYFPEFLSCQPRSGRSGAPMARLNMEERPIWSCLIGRDSSTVQGPLSAQKLVCKTFAPLDATSIVQLRGSGQLGCLSGVGPQVVGSRVDQDHQDPSV